MSEPRNSSVTSLLVIFMQVYHSKAALQKSVLLEHIVFLTDGGNTSLLLIHLHSKGGEQSVLWWV